MEQQQKQEGNFYFDPIILGELKKVQNRVLHNDIDFVAVIDGEAGVGKSVLGMQICKVLDPNFSINNVCFTADEFIKIIRDPKTKKGTAIIMDEAYSSSSARQALSQVNHAINSLAMEMRQRNLFVFFILPSFFDLDKTLSLSRTRALFHVYFTPEMERRYVVFDKDAKKLLFLSGKKTYSYKYPKASFPPARFFNHYTIDEEEYRKKKAEAFTKRPVSNQARNWLLQRNVLIKWLIKTTAINQEQLKDLFTTANVQPITQQQISFILKEMKAEGEIVEEDKIIRN